MVLPADDLRGHVSWGSRGMLFIVLFEGPTKPKICDLKIPSRIEEEVSRLDITVEYVVRMDVLKANNSASYKEFF